MRWIARTTTRIDLVSSPKTIELFRPSTWRDSVGEAVDSFVPKRVVSELKRMPGEDMFQDTLEYLENAYRSAGRSFGQEERAQMEHAVLCRFDLFRSYHGCRPLVFDSYFCDGLLPLTRERLTAIAFDLFEGSVPRVEIEILSRRSNLDLRLGHIFFTADQDELIQHCGHYLIYGPEALCCLWRDDHDRATPRFRESQERHRQRGVPTVFTCDVPIQLIPAEGLRDLVHTLVTNYFRLESLRPMPPNEWGRNWGYSINERLPAEYLRTHVHPAVIPDPLRGYSRYRNPQNRCPWCQP